MQSSDSDSSEVDPAAVAPAADAGASTVAVDIAADEAEADQAGEQAVVDAKAVADEAAAVAAEGGDGSDPSDTYPMLRPLDAYPIDTPGVDGRGQKLLALADPSGIAPGIITLPPFGAAVIELCDGSRTRDEICAEFLARYRRPLPKESLEALLQKLDDAMMLDSTRFRLHCARVFAEFAGLDTRPPLAAGSRYPKDEAELRKLLTDSFSPPNGPALPKDAKLAATDARSVPRVIVTPTVDLARGGPAYAWAYRSLFDLPRLPSLIVIMGCDHAAHDPMVTLSRKHFGTPFGTLQTDIQLVDELVADATSRSEALGELLTRDEAHFRGEHSLEFVVVWLRFIMEWRKQNGLDTDTPPPRILPILVGSLHELAVNPPSRDDKLEFQQTTRLFDEFAIILQQRIGERQKAGEQVLWIGATDLAHVGPRFGDMEGLSESDRDSLERRDRETLKPVLHSDAKTFLGEIRRERDRRRVLALGPLYLLLQSAMPGVGRLRCYAQCSVDAGSYISTASLIYP